MTAFGLAFIAILGLYFYFHFIAKRNVPALAGANLPNKVLFENLVPTAGGEDEHELSYTPDTDSFKPELVEDAEIVLLNEASKMLVEIEDAILSKIDVYEKLLKIVPNYGLFQQTDYYEMVNNYIVLMLKEECAIELTPEQVEAMWII